MGLPISCHEIALAAARLASESALRHSTSERPRFAIGAMGPGTRTITVTGNVTFDEVREGYYLQARGLIEGGVDALLLETVQDTLNVKAAAIGVKRAMAEARIDLPLLVSGTIEPTGTMLAGQGVDALYASLEHLGLFSIGLNCATGPEFMTDHLRTLASIAKCLVTVYPNAGLPDERGQLRGDGGEPRDQDAPVRRRGLGQHGRRLLRDHAGPHPRARPAGGRPAAPRRADGHARRGSERDRGAVSERRQPAGHRRRAHQRHRLAPLQGADRRGQFEEAAEVGRAQVRGGGQVLDVCLANPDRDETADMDRFMTFVTRKVKVPLMIDSTDAAVIEQALRHCQGKAIVNSINLEDGLERFDKVVPLLKTYGAAVVVGCIDDDKQQGMAVTADRKLAIAERSWRLLTETYGVPERDLIFDALVFPVGTGDANYIGSAVATIEGVRAIKQRFPSCKTILGISNVSFGLPAAGPRGAQLGLPLSLHEGRARLRHRQQREAGALCLDPRGGAAAGRGPDLLAGRRSRRGLRRALPGQDQGRQGDAASSCRSTSGSRATSSRAPRTG